jgi:hypothetical protein
MKKIAMFSITLILITLKTYSQKTRDVLYLKNGSVINGTLFEISDNQYKIRAIDKNIFVFKSEEVDKFVKEAPVFEGRKKDGFGVALEAGFLVGSQKNEYDAPFSFNCLLNYTYNMNHILGIGTGVEFIGQTYTPVFAEYKIIISDRKTSPFIFFRTGALTHIAKDDATDSGYSSTIQTKYKGGVSLGIGTGISWANEDSETYLSFAYRYAETSYTTENYMHHAETYNTYYNRLEIKLGFKF